MFLGSRRAPELPVYWDVPAFRLLDQDGRPFSLADAAGHPWVAGFIFTRCAGVCPVMSGRMAAIQRRLPEGARLLSITVDPAHDTPDTLKSYAQRVGAGPRWSFLTGPRDELHRLAVAGFKLEAMEAPPGAPAADGPFLHSGKLALVDAEGRIRGYYDSGDDAAMERLLADLARLAERRG
jgi:protein SCO1/2